jgi:hypothetical protein
MYNVSFMALKWRLHSSDIFGIFEPEQSSVYSLTEVVAAHADMESRKTTGSIILKPEFT